MTKATSGPETMERCELHHCELPCEVCAEQAEDARKRKQSAVMRGLSDIMIGKRYKDKTFADYEPVTEKAQEIKAKCEKYVSTFANRLANGDSLIFLGEPGTGKNMLAAIICQEIVKKGHTALHTTAMKAVRRVRKSWKNPDMDEQVEIDRFAAPDLLVIDEIGKQMGSVSEENLLFEIINGRYEENKPTILISNCDLDGVEAYLGRYIVDRFHEGLSGIYKFDWESYRRRG